MISDRSILYHKSSLCIQIVESEDRIVREIRIFLKGCRSRRSLSDVINCRISAPSARIRLCLDFSRREFLVACCLSTAMLSSIFAAFQSPEAPEGVQQRPPRYVGEDTTPTSRQEILGWYSYGIAAEVFAVCGVGSYTHYLLLNCILIVFPFLGSFLPLTLEQLARERGTLQTSRLPCTGPSAGNSTNNEDGQCVVPIFGLEINTASFAMYTFSLAVLIQALTLISFSALADYGMVAKVEAGVYSRSYWVWVNGSFDRMCREQPQNIAHGIRICWLVG